MKKALFVHDARFRKYDSKYYSINLSAEIWRKNYLKHFSELLIMCRCRLVSEIGDVSGLVLSDCENVGFSHIYHDNLQCNYVMFYRKMHKQIYVNVEACDAVIVRLPSFLGGKALNIARKLDKPYLIEMVGCPWDALWNHSLLGKLLAPFSWFGTKQLLKRAPYVIYVTNKFLQKRYPTIGISTNCSNVMLPLLGKDMLERRLIFIKSRQNEKKIVLGTTAAVNIKYKGQQYVIEALSVLKKKYNDTSFEYQLVGGGDCSFLQEVAQKYGVENQVKFLGSQTHDNVFEWLDTIDIYIQPSRTEGMPRALIEAMSRGLAACGSSAGGIPELLDESFIFSNSRGEVEEITALLLKLKSPELRREQAIRNFEEAKLYESEKNNERRQSIFVKFLNEQK